VVCAALHGAECQQCPGAFQWVRPLRSVGVGSRRFEHLDRPLVLAVRSEKKAPATASETTDRGIRLRGLGVEQRQQPFGYGKVADVDERLDPGRARELGEGFV